MILFRCFSEGLGARMAILLPNDTKNAKREQNCRFCSHFVRLPELSHYGGVAVGADGDDADAASGLGLDECDVVLEGLREVLEAAQAAQRGFQPGNSL